MVNSYFDTQRKFIRLEMEASSSVVEESLYRLTIQNIEETL